MVRRSHLRRRNSASRYRGFGFARKSTVPQTKPSSNLSDQPFVNRNRSRSRSRVRHNRSRSAVREREPSPCNF